MSTSSQGKIADRETVQFAPSMLETSLKEVPALDLRYGRGFLLARPEAFVPGIEQQWASLFLSLGVESGVEFVKCSAQFPAELHRVIICQLGAEYGVIGMSEEAQELIAETVLPGARGAAAELVVEYLERRLLSTINSSWSAKQAIVCHYILEPEEDEVEIIGSIEIGLRLNGRIISLWLGLGPQLVDMLDGLWKDQLRSYLPNAGEKLRLRSRFSDNIYTVSLELGELVVPPPMLIDYLRSGTIINLEKPFAQQVSIVVDGQPVARAKLRQCNKMFALDIKELLHKERNELDGNSRICVELARFDLDADSLNEWLQEGALLSSSVKVSSIASLVIGGEHVANAVVGEIGKNLAISVLPK